MIYTRIFPWLFPKHRSSRAVPVYPERSGTKSHPPSGGFHKALLQNPVTVKQFLSLLFAVCSYYMCIFLPAKKALCNFLPVFSYHLQIAAHLRLFAVTEGAQHISPEWDRLKGVSSPSFSCCCSLVQRDHAPTLWAFAFSLLRRSAFSFLHSGSFS